MYLPASIPESLPLHITYDGASYALPFRVVINVNGVPFVGLGETLQSAIWALGDTLDDVRTALRQVDKLGCLLTM